MIDLNSQLVGLHADLDSSNAGDTDVELAEEGSLVAIGFDELGHC